MDTKKSFYRNSVGFYLIVTLFVAIFISVITVIILGITNKLTLSVWEYIIFILATFIVVLPIIELVGYKIVLYKDRVYVGKDNNIILLRVQHKVDIKYSDIVNIELEFSATNSQRKSIRGNKATNIYLLFTLQNSKHKRVCINYYSKKRVLSLVQEIANRSHIELSEKFIEDINKLIRL